jgi:hypothetical protein
MPRKTCWNTVVLCFFFAAWAGLAFADSSSPLVRLSGRVLDGDGLPVAGAIIWTPRGDGPASTSAVDGSFELFRAAGYHQILAVRQGFADAWAGVDLARGEVEGITLQMKPGAVVTGRVLGLEPEDGEVSVTATSEGVHPLLGEHRTVAEPDGRYRVPDLAPGEWYLTARAGDRLAAWSVKLLPGQAEAVRDIPLPPKFTVRGRVVGPDGAPIQGAQVRLLNDWRRVGPTMTGADGTFAFRLDSGTYVFLARYGDFGLGRAESAVQVPGGPAEGATVRLGPPAVIEGRVLGLTRRELSNATLKVHELDSTWQPHIERDAKGRFRIAGLGGGDWELFSASLDREARGAVRLEPGGKGMADIVYAVGKFKLAVCFAGSGSGRGYPVVLHRAESPEGPSLGFDETDISGCVRFTRLEAGRYLLVEGIGLDQRHILEVDLDSDLRIRFDTATRTWEKQ